MHWRQASYDAGRTWTRAHLVADGRPICGSRVDRARSGDVDRVRPFALVDDAGGELLFADRYPIMVVAAAPNAPRCGHCRRRAPGR